MVVDTSIVLAIFFGEEHGEWAAAKLQEHEGELVMSTVNLAEALIRLRDRQPARFPELEAQLLTSSIRFQAPDARQAQSAADARMKYPLNLGDCFAYALARVRSLPILTLDSDFRTTDCSVVMPS
jgi:ribonuclease VapC